MSSEIKNDKDKDIIETLEDSIVNIYECIEEMQKRLEVFSSGIAHSHGRIISYVGRLTQLEKECKNALIMEQHQFGKIAKLEDSVSLHNELETILRDSVLALKHQNEDLKNSIENLLSMAKNQFSRLEDIEATLKEDNYAENIYTRLSEKFNKRIKYLEHKLKVLETDRLQDKIEVLQDRLDEEDLLNAIEEV